MVHNNDDVHNKDGVSLVCLLGLKRGIPRGEKYKTNMMYRIKTGSILIINC